MKRRTFLILGSVVGLFVAVASRKNDDFKEVFQQVEQTLLAVQEHMFPEKSMLPSAKSINATQFLFETMSNKSFDKDIRVFVVEGAKELERRERGHFAQLAFLEKENALRAYEKTNYGSSWLSRIMTLTMEALFADPVYGANTKEKGWNALGSYGGFPRPATRYMEPYKDV